MAKITQSDLAYGIANFISYNRDKVKNSKNSQLINIVEKASGLKPHLIPVKCKLYKFALDNIPEDELVDNIYYFLLDNPEYIKIHNSLK